MMECHNGCLKPMESAVVERFYYHTGGPIVIRELEVYSCPECGCESLPLRSARLVEKVLAGRMEPAGLFSAPALYLDIALHGIALYDLEGYAAAWLARLRLLLDGRGLRREVSQRDLTWCWRRFPGFDWSLEWEVV